MRFISQQLIVGLSLVFSVVGRAATETPSPLIKADALSYYRDNACPEDKQVEGLQAQEVLSIDEFFAREGLLGTNTKFGQGELILEVDEIYADSELSRLVLTKFCLEPLNSGDIGKLADMGGGDFLYHAKTPAGLPFAMYFVGHSLAAAQALTSAMEAAIRSATVSEKTSAKQNEDEAAWYSRLNPSQWIVGSVWAQKSGMATSHAIETRRMKELRERRRSAEAQPKNKGAANKAAPEGSAPADKKDTLRDVFSNVGHCMKGLGQGVYNATVGVVEFAVRSVFSFVKSAVFAARHPKEAWASVSSGTKQVVDVIRKFNVVDFTKKEARGFKAMPLHLKTEFICRLIAQVGTSAAIAIFAAPTISAQAVVLWEIMNRYKSMGKFKQWFFDAPPSGAVKAKGSKGIPSGAASSVGG